MATPIISVSGVGTQTADILVENGYKDAESLAKANVQDLLKISGFGPVRANNLIAAAQELVGDGEHDPDEVEATAKKEDTMETPEPVVKKEKGKVKAKKKKKSSKEKSCSKKLCKKKKKNAKADKAKKKKKGSRKKKSK